MKRPLTFEQCLYLLAFLIGLSLRLFRLGLPPLGESEASWAMQALQVLKGGALQIGSQPGYVLLTGLFFWLMGSSNFLARFLPALTGSLLIFLPYLFRHAYEDSEWLRKAELVMAFGLALDPGLVTLSRQAGSALPAITFTMLACAMYYQRRWVLLGVLGGLALLSGPALVAGVLGLSLAWGLFQLVLKLGWVTKGQIVWQSIEEGSAAWRKSLLALGITILAAGLLFLRYPQGLGAMVRSLPDYLHGWLQAGEVPALRLPVALLIYQPLALLFALIAALRGWLAAHSGLRVPYLSQVLSLWALAALGLAVMYLSRQVTDLAWALIPLWALAAMEIARHLQVGEDRPTRRVALGLAGLVLLLMVISWVNLLSLVRMNGNQVIMVVVIIGALVMAGIASFLVAMGWSYPAARLGFHWGLATGLALWVLAATFNLVFYRPNDPRELLSPLPAAGQISALVDTLHDLSDWQTGLNEQIDILVTVPSEALRWALRANPNVSFATSPQAETSPDLVITWKDQETPSLAQVYRGQDFVLNWYPGWQSVLPSPWLRWLTYRQAPVAQLQIVLWARVDIFPDGDLNWLELTPAEETLPILEEQTVP